MMASLFQKLANRKAALQLSKWNDKKKEKVQSILNIEYISSEEDGEGDDVTKLMIIPLEWESDKLRRYKAHLDKLYLENTTRHALVQLKRRKRKDSVSSRKAPENAPSWTVRNSVDETDEYTFNE
ncbi:MAG: hypothetical protein KZQ70_15170 [gamma proteobacterium symbiont of Lucinoma myriamae]|nr:hypothetical protein [gamma proteobacterium symbiont of Lucinoma myriamae]